MSEAADLVRSAYDRINEGDVDGFVALCSPQVSFQDVPEIPGSRLYRGHEGVRAWAEGVREVSEDLRFAIWEIEERGDAVLIENSADMTGSRSGAEVGWRFWTVWRVRDGLITYHHGYSQRSDALADYNSST